MIPRSRPSASDANFNAGFFLLFTIGWISIFGQVVVLRELNVAFFGVELIYVLALGVWLFSTALGALIGRRRLQPGCAAIRWGTAAAGILLPLDIAYVRGMRLIFGGVSGAYLPFLQQMTGLCLALLPLGLLSGLLFQWAAKYFIGCGRTLAAAYGVESAGGLVGGLAATLLLAVGMQNFSLAVGGGLLAAGSAGAYSRSRRGTIRWLPGAAALLLFVLLPTPRIDRAMTRWVHPGLVAGQDTPYGRITFAAHAQQVAVFENDALMFETQSTAAEELVHAAALQHPSPRTVLVVGGGVTGIVSAVLQHAPLRVDCAELNAGLVALARRHLPSEAVAGFETQRVDLHITDPRKYLERCPAYDLILVGMPPPVSGQTNRFYTAEFFRQCRQKLNPGGILAFRLPAAENLWTPLLAMRNASIQEALETAFRHVLVLPGGVNILAASETPLSRLPQTSIQRLRERGIRSRLVSAAYLNYLYTNDRFAAVQREIAAVKAAPNTDLHPICYPYSVLIWISKFLPAMIHWEFRLQPNTMAAAGLCSWVLASAAFLAVRRKDTVRRVLLVFVAGLAGMILETLLLLYYQVRSGVLFQNIGVLLMALMGGLTIGAFSMDGFAQKRLNRSSVTSAQIGYLPLFLLAADGAFLYLCLRQGWALGLAAAAGMLFAAGFGIAGVFAFAGFSAADQRTAVSRLYAADLLGGCLAAVLGSLVMIPFAGMTVSTLWVSGLVLLSLLLI